MPSEFTAHFTRQLVSPNSRPTSPTSSLSTDNRKNLSSHGHNDAIAHRKTELHALLSSISQQSLSADDVQSYTSRLQNITAGWGSYTADAIHDDEVSALEEAIVGKLVVTLYSNALDIYLNQAADVEAEAEWWLEVERSRANVVLYFVQTLPGRLIRVTKTIIQVLRTNHLPLNLSSLSPSSIRALFPSPPRLTLRPGLLATAFFPFLKHQKSLTVAVLLSPTNVSSKPASRARTFRDYAYSAYRFANLPLELTRQECIYTRKMLERTRDQRAECLGELAKLRTTLSSLIHRAPSTSFQQYTSFIALLTRIASSSTPTAEPSSPFNSLTDLAQTLPAVSLAHTDFLRQNNLLRPSPLTRMWPSLLIVPPMILYAYANRVSWTKAIVNMAGDAKETVKGFVRGWLIEPLIGVLNTVRAGGKGQVLVREGGVVSDLESLERMAISLARDSLQYTPDQLDTLAKRVRIGDLTPVMQIYEEDIKTPFRSALTGTLLRNLFIQVQKAKVDIDQALSGIDHLLKSQELTFAFVGVAPALAVVYAVLGTSERLWNVVSGRGNLGGKQRRRAIWEGMRRIERILILHPETDVGEPIGSLPTGLLLLSLTRLRSYALDHLPMRLRTPFLEDLGDLEDTNLDRHAKLRIVDRIWRSWGKVGEGVIVSS